MICFITSQGVIYGTQAYFTDDLKKTDDPNPTLLPPVMCIDEDLNTRGFSVFKVNNGDDRIGVGLVMSVSGEAKNGVGQTV